MPGGSVRRVSRQDIQLVQNLIERCLQLYMNQKEVVDTLLFQAKIEPDFTSLVWQKLEEENQEFFKAYYLRLMVKHQIIEFNRLLDQQARLMHQMHPSGVASITISNGSHIPSLHPNSACYTSDHVGPALKPENMHHAVGSCLPNAFTNGGSSMHTGMHGTVEMSVHAGRLDAAQNMLSTQNSNMGLMHAINGGIIKSEVGGMVKPEVGGVIKSEVGYSSTRYLFGADNNVLEGRTNIGDSSVAHFSSVHPNSQPLNDSLLDADTSSFGFLGQIPRNFSLSDLTADFSQSSDILESYSRSPFLPPDAEEFLDSRERGDPQGDSKRLDTISEGLSYEDFGSE